jgi:predicted TPR repeat methyltransferase
VQPWTLRLWYAYADALLAAGRRDDAIEWFGSAAAIDEDDDTDAAERLAALIGGAGE